MMDNIIVSGTVFSKSFEEAKKDVYVSVIDFLGHGYFDVTYDAEAIRTIGGQLIGYQVEYEARSTK